MKNLNDIFNTEQQGPPKQPFDVPSGYFETFEDRLEAKIEAMEEKPNTRRTILRVLKPVLGLAASFLLILLLIKYPLTKITPELLSQDEPSLSEDADWWREAVTGNSIFFDDNTLVNTMNSDETTNTASESNEIMTILSAELNDYEVFAELYN